MESTTTLNGAGEAGRSNGSGPYTNGAHANSAHAHGADDDQTTATRDRLYATVALLADEMSTPDLDAEALSRIAARAAEDLRTVAEEASAAGAGADASAAAGAKFVVADRLVDDLLADFDARKDLAARNGGVVGVRTGLDHLDEALNGLQAGSLYMLAAMPACGKTTLALQWAATVAQSGRPALYISLENDALDLVRKIACRFGQTSYAAAHKGKGDRAAWAEAVGKLDKLGGRLYLSTPRTTMPDLDALVRDVTAHAGEAPALVVLDYLQAFAKRAARGNDGAELRERIDLLTPQLRALGERSGCAVLAVSSQNRANYAGGGMAALKESGDLEYGADAVLSLGRVDQDKDKEMWDKWVATHEDPTLTPLKLTIDKNRQGLTGKRMTLTLDGDYCMFEEEPSR